MIVDVAKEPGIIEQTLGKWIAKDASIAARGTARPVPIGLKSPICSANDENK
jgi:hypothetical protein